MYLNQISSAKNKFKDLRLSKYNIDVDSQIDRIHSICFLGNEEHILDSVLTKCGYCDKDVWLELGEVDKVPVCISCAADLIVDNKIRISTQFDKADIKKLFRFLLEKRKKEVANSMKRMVDRYAKEIACVKENGRDWISVIFQDGTRWIPKAKDLAIIVSMIGKLEDERHPMGEGHLMIKNFINESFGKTAEEIVQLYNMKYDKGGWDDRS